MKTARTRINYVGASDIEYTEIRPIRPNQSVILAGLGVTGSRVTKEMKDRRYRSTQGAGYSDGLVIHSRPATQDSRHGGGKYSASPGGEHPSINFWSTPPTAILDQRQGTGGSNGVNGVNGGYNQNVMDKIYPHYDMRNPRILFEDEVFVPVTSGHQQNTGGQRSTSVSPVRSPQHNFNMNTSYSGAGGHEEGVRMRHPTNTKNMATTYDVFFDQHLQNLANQETEESPSRLSFSTRSGSTPITARFREASCQTPTEFNMRLSPMITTASRYGGSLSDISVPKIIEDCLEEEEGEDHDNQNESPNKLELDDVTDDELDMIGDFMVKESLDSAATNLDNSIKDFTDLDGDLSYSDLREDQFTLQDYYRAGLTPPPELMADATMGSNSRSNPKKDLKFVPEQENFSEFESIHVNSSKIEDLPKQMLSPRKVIKKK